MITTNIRVEEIQSNKDNTNKLNRDIFVYNINKQTNNNIETQNFLKQNSKQTKKKTFNNKHM